MIIDITPYAEKKTTQRKLYTFGIVQLLTRQLRTVDVPFLSYAGEKNGAAAAEKSGFNSSLATQNIKIDLVTRIATTDINPPPYNCTFVPDIISKSWVKGFFKQAIKDFGLDFIINNVTIDGQKIHQGWSRFFIGISSKYLFSEKRRIERDKENERISKGGTWSKPCNLFVPDIGTLIRLSEDWSFRLYSEYRNDKLLEAIGQKCTYQQDMPNYPVSILKDTTLTVDRIYIRKGLKDFSSISFVIKSGKMRYEDKEINITGRFWAKLSDVNKMVVEIEMETLSKN